MLLLLDTIHIPSTPNDVDYMTQNFKSVLGDIFYQRKSTDMNDMCLDQSPLPVSVTVKGPLNVQQYYDLSGKDIHIYIYKKGGGGYSNILNI